MVQKIRHGRFANQRWIIQPETIPQSPLSSTRQLAAQEDDARGKKSSEIPGHAFGHGEMHYEIGTCASEIFRAQTRSANRE